MTREAGSGDEAILSRHALAGLVAIAAALNVFPRSPLNAAFPGANGRLAFEREAPAGDHTQTDIYSAWPDGDAGDIYVIDLESGRLHRVTRSPEYDHQVAWSPDGKRIVFERDLTSSASIFAVGVDGLNLARLTSGRFFDAGPAFSPDGRFIAFGSDRGGGFLHDLWVMDADGGNKRRIREMEFSEGCPDWQPFRE